MLSTPEVLRRTGGKPVKSIVFDEATIAARVGGAGRRDHRGLSGRRAAGARAAQGELHLPERSGAHRSSGRSRSISWSPAPTAHGKVSSGTVRLLYDPETKLEGKHILLVEDIIDTGKTLQRLMALLGARRPRSLAICALLDKQLAVEVRPELRFVGFRAPPAFLVGYGLDHAENYRHLPFIADLE